MIEDLNEGYDPHLRAAVSTHSLAPNIYESSISIKQHAKLLCSVTSEETLNLMHSNAAHISHSTTFSASLLPDCVVGCSTTTIAMQASLSYVRSTLPHDSQKISHISDLGGHFSDGCEHVQLRERHSISTSCKFFILTCRCRYFSI